MQVPVHVGQAQSDGVIQGIPGVHDVQANAVGDITEKITGKAMIDATPTFFITSRRDTFGRVKKGSFLSSSR